MEVQTSLLEDYLEQLASQLRLDTLIREKIVQEIRCHLEESAAGFQSRGRSPEESMVLAIDRFGKAGEMARVMRQVHVESANQAVLSALLPVAMTMAFKWVILPCVRMLAGSQGHLGAAVVLPLVFLALLIPGLTSSRWRYGYAAWAFFSIIAIAQT